MVVRCIRCSGLVLAIGSAWSQRRMPFAVQWIGHLGRATTHRDAAVEAIRFAIEMLGKGYADVVIVDSADGGKAYAPAQFAQFYKNAKRYAHV